MKCTMDDKCTRSAIYAPKICVPAVGWPIDMHQPIAGVMMLPTCSHHIKTVTIENFMTDQLKEVMEVLCEGRQPPDFARAWVQWIKVDSIEYQNMMKAKEKNEQ